MQQNAGRAGRRVHRGRAVGMSLGLAALLALSASCSRSMIADPIDTAYRPGDIAGEMAYWRELQQRPVVTNDEGLHGLILLAVGRDDSRTYAARVEFAQVQGWVGDGFEEHADLAMQRGTLARGVALICGIKGGVMMRLVGPTPRYAVRELAYLGIMAGGSELQTVSGAEYTGVISKAQDYLAIHDREPQIKEPTGDPPRTR